MGFFSLLLLLPISIQSISHSLSIVLLLFSFPVILFFVQFSFMPLLFLCALVFLNHCLFGGRKALFSLFIFWFCIILNSLCFSGLVFFCLSITWFYPFHIFAVLPFSRVPSFLCFLQKRMLLLLIIIDWIFFCLLPMECYFQNCEIL